MVEAPVFYLKALVPDTACEMTYYIEVGRQDA
jgi:hypothetical protein